MNFSEVLADVKFLAQKISASGYEPDFLVGLARGGWIPTRLLSNALHVKEILSIGMKYADSTRTTLIAYSLPAPMPVGKRLLLVEDCLESGKSLVEAKKILESADNEVRTASLYVTDKTQTQPDYFVKHYPVPPQFPWE